MAKILVVDDNPDIAEVMSDFLSEENHTVFTASNGTDAIALAQGELPDLIFLDIEMPGMSGVEVCQKLRSLESTQLTPIIIVTGRTDDTTLMEAIKAGCDDFLSKPPNIPILKARVESLLKMTRLRNQVREKEKFEYMVHNMSEGLIITDKTGKIIRCNSAAARMFNRDPETLPGVPYFQMIRDTFNDFQVDWKEILSQKHGEFSIEHKDAEFELAYAMHIKYDALTDPISEIDEVLFVTSDETDRVRARLKLEEALELAKKADQVKTLFIANMSHEIRTPLNSILGFTELIQQSVSEKVDPSEQEFFEIVHTSGERLMKTVHEILDISQIEAGTIELNFQPLDINNLLQGLVQEFLPKAKGKNIGLKYTTTLEKAVVDVDEYTMTQALTNLVENAVKYTEEGQVKITLDKNQYDLFVTIQDTGIGMSPEYMQKLFDIFSQESTGYTKKYQGVGLGLALAKRHLDLNGSSIDVESEKGMGTTVSITIPFRGAKESTQPVTSFAEPAPVVQSSQESTILVVEDDITSQKLVSYYLDKEYNLYFARSVLEAKEQLEAHPVDLILLDLSLEGDEDGLDLARYLRKTNQWKEIPIVALTAHAFVTDRENVMQAGCNTYLTKPIRPKNLLENIQKYLT